MTPSLSFCGILFDMDGLLLDTERVAEKCWHTAEKETGFYMPDGFYFTLIGQAMPLIERRLADVMDPYCDLQAFLKVANREYKNALSDGAIPVKDGAEEILAFLSDRQIPVCLATSTFSQLAHHKLASTGLLRWLPLRVCGDEVEHGKPAPDIYLRAAATLGQQPQDLLVLEDSENGLRAGLEAGCQVLHVPDIAPVSLVIQARASRIYRDLFEVRRAIERRELRYMPSS